MLAIKLQEKELVQIKNDSIKDYYEAFMGKYGEGTRKAYKTALNLMSNFFYGKDMQFLSLEEIRDISMLDIMKLNSWLNEEIDDGNGGKKKRYKINTVNKHINGMKSFFRFLNKEFSDISDAVFGNIDLANPEKDMESYGGLEWDEAVALWEYAKDNLRDKSTKMSMLIKLACVTSIRAEALINLTWSGNWKVKNERGILVNYIDVIDKGKRHKKPVSEEFYNELRKALTDDKLFLGLNKDNINPLLQRCINGIGLDPRRNIKFHSLKGAGVTRAFDITDSIYKAKEQGNHSSIITSEKHYLKYKESLVDMVSYGIEERINIKDSLQDYTKEELILAISRMREGSQKELLNILEK